MYIMFTSILSNLNYKILQILFGIVEAQFEKFEKFYIWVMQGGPENPPQGYMSQMSVAYM